MIKSWLKMWKNSFNYKGAASRKEYWYACIINVPAMFIFVIPFALILRNFPISPELASAIFMILFHIPTVALYFRRANDANIKPLTTLYMALACPVLSGFIVGVFPSIPKEETWPKFGSIIGKYLAFGFALYFYGALLGILINDDVASMSWLVTIGLFIMAAPIVIVSLIYVVSCIKAYFGK